MHSRERKIVFQIFDGARWFLCTARQWHMELHPIHLMASPNQTLFAIDLHSGGKILEKIIIIIHYCSSNRWMVWNVTNLHLDSRAWVSNHRCLPIRPVLLQTMPMSWHPIADRRAWIDCRMRIFSVRTPLVHGLGLQLRPPLLLCSVPSLPDRSVWFVVSFCRCTDNVVSWCRWELHPIYVALLSPVKKKSNSIWIRSIIHPTFHHAVIYHN